MSKALSVEHIISRLEAADLRPTRPRRVIAAQIVAWGQERRDFTSEELWHAAQEKAPWLGRATAYRTVQLLAEFGFLDRITFADGTERYHVIMAGEHHHHLTCEQCHRVVEVDECLDPHVLEALGRASGFAISGHRFEIFGRCPDCQACAPLAARPQFIFLFILMQSVYLFLPLISLSCFLPFGARRRA